MSKIDPEAMTQRVEDLLARIRVAKSRQAIDGKTEVLGRLERVQNELEDFYQELRQLRELQGPYSPLVEAATAALMKIVASSEELLTYLERQTLAAGG